MKTTVQAKFQRIAGDRRYTFHDERVATRVQCQ
jgi:hypothetical protein